MPSPWTPAPHGRTTRVSATATIDVGSNMTIATITADGKQLATFTDSSEVGERRMAAWLAQRGWQAQADPDRVARNPQRERWQVPVEREMVEATDLIGVAEAARIADLSERSIRTYVSRGTIPAPIPVAGSDALVWDRQTIEEWTETRRGRGRPGSGAQDG
jgi:predicted DNA-binding transcriptional regulator AlpA